jgi:hypothetical protein
VASGGLEPATAIEPAAIKAIGDIGWDIAYEKPQGLADVVPPSGPVVGIALEAGLELPSLPDGTWQNWDLPALTPGEPDAAPTLVAAIEKKVQALLTQI